MKIVNELSNSSSRMRKVIFISSPLRGDYEKNISLAKLYCRWVSLQGYVALAPHLIFTSFLDDDNEAERQLGIYSGLVLLEKSDEVWFFCESEDKMSEGMRSEFHKAIELGKLTKFVKPSSLMDEEP